MIRKITRKIKSSIFLKMLIVIVGTGMLINIVVGNFYRLQLTPSTDSGVKTHLEKYAHYVIKDMGDPPNKERAIRLAKELNLWIKYTGPSGSWATHPDFPQDFKNQHFGNQSKLIRWIHGRFFVEIHEGESTFLFSQSANNIFELQKEYIIFLLITVSLILAGAYLLIRRILQPIRWLRNGVNEVAKGNFDQPIPIRKNDELGELSQSFNTMSSRIKEMINARDQLLLDVSHELRSPLTRIKVSLELMDKDSTRGSIADDIHEIETMITEILESERINSKHGKLEKRNIDLISLITNLVQDYRDSYPGIVLKSNPDQLIFEADEERLRTAFKNIIDNALKYSTETSNPVEINVQQKDKFIYITFKDTGIGIDNKHLPYIFEPFYRVDSSRSKKTGGYGLGMSLCKKIIESHGGTITIESKSGEGTTIFITLPLAADNSNAS
jgi:signal transduction histidine kinase